MAAKRKPARRTRKPKFIEIDGHQLTEGMHADYEHCLESRARTNSGDTAEQIERLALDDFLSGYRPSRKIKMQLSNLYLTTSRVSLAISSMSDYTFFSPTPPSIRSAGCKLLRELAQELSSTADTLSALAAGVETETDGKIQDWLTKARALVERGSSMEFAHGNC